MCNGILGIFGGVEFMDVFCEKFIFCFFFFFCLYMDLWFTVAY